MELIRELGYLWTDNGNFLKHHVCLCTQLTRAKYNKNRGINNSFMGQKNQFWEDKCMVAEKIEDP